MITFRIQYLVKDVGLSNKIFDFQDEKENCFISIQNIPNNCLYKGKNESQFGKFFVTATIKRKPIRKVAEWLENTTESLPREFDSFADDSEIILRNSVIKFLKQLRWITGYRSSFMPSMRFYNFEWCIENEQWKSISKITADNGTITLINITKVSDNFTKQLQDVRLDDFDEPLAHELFQEAWDRKSTDGLRSALVMVIAAAETGVKHFIAKLAPETEWLLQNIQSPPLVDLLENYLPLLAENKLMNPPLHSVPESLKLILKKGINLRNAIVHGKNIEIKSKTIEELFSAINDILYVLDYHSGHKWAAEHVSNKTQKEWLKLI